MSKYNITTPSGFLEWTPSQKRMEETWLKTIREVFESYGFFPIETPLVEREENLLAKGGNAKEMYALKRILDDPSDTTHSGNALRFDLTVPLALYIARHFNEIAFPFRRYAIGSVFRGERAQKGRFRQFTQCDIDIIGNENLAIENDALMPAIIISLFEKLAIGDFIVRINNRKLLTGLAEFLGGTEYDLKSALIYVDNLEKSIDEPTSEFIQKFAKEFPRLTTRESLSSHEAMQNQQFQKGVEELDLVWKTLQTINGAEKVQFDIKIARGLNYYTGTVFETNLLNADKILNTSLGSICSGGRYDDLAEIFTGKKLPGVGISIGLTRLLSKLFETDFLSQNIVAPADFLICSLNKSHIPTAMEIAGELRKKGHRVENYLEDKKLGKQFEYAEKLHIQKCILVGEDEEIKWREKKTFVQKNLETGEQTEIQLSEL